MKLLKSKNIVYCYYDNPWIQALFQVVVKLLQATNEKK